jgi:hypothetical protein
MAEEEFHVHGLHEYAVEEQGYHQRTGLAQPIALVLITTLNRTLAAACWRTGSAYRRGERGLWLS